MSRNMSVGLSVHKVYCGKTAEWIRIPFGMVSGVGRGMGVLDGVAIVEGSGAVFGVNLGRPILTNGDFEFAMRLFPNYTLCRTCFFSFYCFYFLVPRSRLSSLPLLISRIVSYSIVVLSLEKLLSE